MTTDHSCNAHVVNSTSAVSGQELGTGAPALIGMPQQMKIV